MSGLDLFTVCKHYGWEWVGGDGSHRVMEKDGRSISIPVHGNDDLGIGLLKTLLDQAGLPRPRGKKIAGVKKSDFM